jgi:UDP-glucose 4-epimerase
MKRALVTGAAGFLGSHVADELIELGVSVVAVDDLSGGFWRNLPSDCEFRRLSISNSRSVDALFRARRFDYVFHLAAYAAEGLSHFIRRFNYTNNLLGSVNLINAAVRHGVECFVFTSSAAVYGDLSAPATEDTPPAPADPYAIAKLAVEHDLRAAGRLFGLRWIVFRPHNVYGERQNLADPYRNVIGIFMRQATLGQPCSIFGDGRQTRAFSYVADVAPVIARAVNVPGAFDQVFNIGADRSCSILEAAELVQIAVGNRVGIECLPARAEAAHVVCDHRKLRAILPCSAPTPIEEGVRRMAEWVRTLQIAPPRPIGGIEIPRNLPPSWRRLTSAETPAAPLSARSRSNHAGSGYTPDGGE